MRTEIDGTEISRWFDSLGEFAQVASERRDEFLAAHGGGIDPSFYGVSRFDEAVQLAREGWSEGAQGAIDIAEKAVAKVEREHDMPAFHPVWDVAGCEVDVARYLAHEPENMVDYEIVPTTKAGRVIVVCASVSYSGSLSVETVRRRGHIITALILALSKLGYSVEVWADTSAARGGKIARDRVLVKGASDPLDTASIMFAFTHPAMLRVLEFAAMHALPKSWQSAIGVGSSYGGPASPKRDLPEGTIYLPELRSDYDVPDADEALLGYLRLLGIVND
jgi:hypothetical protein